MAGERALEFEIGRSNVLDLSRTTNVCSSPVQAMLIFSFVAMP